jgi:hypothetical protein
VSVDFIEIPAGLVEAFPIYKDWGEEKVHREEIR